MCHGSQLGKIHAQLFFQCNPTFFAKIFSACSEQMDDCTKHGTYLAQMDDSYALSGLSVGHTLGSRAKNVSRIFFCIINSHIDVFNQNK